MKGGGNNGPETKGSDRGRPNAHQTAFVPENVNHAKRNLKVGRKYTLINGHLARLSSSRACVNGMNVQDLEEPAIIEPMS